jgi:probable HAF family extracellular repeat protein
MNYDNYQLHDFRSPRQHLSRPDKHKQLRTVAGYYQDSSGHFDGFLDSHGTYTTINPPGSIDTFVQSINSSGQITGYYEDSSGQDIGFLYSHGTYTTIDPPGSTETFAQSINSSGQITGYYEDSSGQDIGFLYSHGTYTTIDPPGSVFTDPQSINNSGQITGYYIDSSGQYHGFLYSSGTVAANITASSLDRQRRLSAAARPIMFPPVGPTAATSCSPVAS